MSHNVTNSSDIKPTAHKQDETSPAEPTYKLVINENVIEKIASRATQEIDGVIDMKGSLLSTIQEGLGGSNKAKGALAEMLDNKNVSVDLDVILEYGKSAPRIFDEIKQSVTKHLKEMTGLNLTEMTVTVVDVMTPDEFTHKTGTSANEHGGSD